MDSYNIFKILVTFLLTLFPTYLVKSEFYFCSNGPQRIKSMECKGGLLMTRKPIDSRCVAVAKDKNIHRAKVTLKPLLCDDDSLDKTFNTENSTTTFQADVSFQVVYHEYRIDGGKGGPKTRESQNESSQIGSCLKKCLDDWIDPNTEMDDDAPYDFTFGQPSAEVVTEQEKISQDLFNYMLTLDTTNSPPPNSFKLEIFQNVFNVLEKHCAPFVDSDYAKSIFAAFQFLVSNQKSNDVDPQSQRRILDILQTCNVNPSKFVITSHKCGHLENSRIKAINGVKSKLQGKYFRWGTFDVILEGAWMAIEFVHAYCYKEFIHDENSHHILTIAMASLFSEKLQQRWMFPHKVRQDQFWNNLVGVKNLNLTMRNIEACIVAGQRVSGMGRIGRPFENDTDEKPLSGTNQGRSPVSDGVKGFQGTLIEYWKAYDENGGVKAALLGHGICASDEEELEAHMETPNGDCNPQTRNSEDKEKGDEEGDDEENNIDK